jgi:plastocyanin
MVWKILAALAAVVIIIFGVMQLNKNKSEVSVTPNPTPTPSVTQETPPPSEAPVPPPSETLTPPPSQTPSPSPTPTGTPNPTPTPSPVIITITSAGFSPNNVTVKAGTKVIFQNNDTKGHWPASNPHPTHTDLPGFDALKAVASGSSYSYTFTKVGTWGYHDHLFTNLGGKVTVTN